MPANGFDPAAGSCLSQAFEDKPILTRIPEEESTLKNIPEEESNLKKRLEKLVRTYDSVTMKIFITIECLGEGRTNAVYCPSKKHYWEQFLDRREACRLDVNKNQKLKQKYNDFLSLPKEQQGKDFHKAMIFHLHLKGAVDCFRQVSPNTIFNVDGSKTFVQQIVNMFDKKLTSWFSSFEAVSVSLSGHVKVSNFVRILTGNVDIFARRNNLTYIIDIKTTAQESPRPMDVINLCLLKMLSIQNGLEDPNKVRLVLLVLHVTPHRPVLRLWEYEPTVEMERAIREADIDKLIDAGIKSQYHEFWRDNTNSLDNCFLRA